MTAHDRVRNRFYHEGHSCEIILLTFCLFAPLRILVRQSINNIKTIEISHYCLVTEALPRQISRGVRSLSSLPRLRFSSHRGKFEENKMAADEVSPRAYAPILSSGTVGGAYWINEEFIDKNTL